MSSQDPKEYQRQTGCSWSEALEAMESREPVADVVDNAWASGPLPEHYEKRDRMGDPLSSEVASDFMDEQRQIGKAAINGLDYDLLPETDSESDEPSSYNPLDPYGIPDESDSLEAITLVRELERGYGDVPQKPVIDSQKQKVFRMTDKELENIANSTGQSEDTVLLERHITRDDVEPSDVN